ncbi:MAG: glycosyltransferase family 2 protein [Gemmatimonadetes bacterium]|nr:glycosyltransferase family 2 protein [Gemmatimonadota bacterium]
MSHPREDPSGSESPRPSSLRDTPRVSVAIPLYNEEGGLVELVRRLTAVLDGIDGGPHELVLVDDGSRDRTPELLRQAARRDPRIRVVLLSRNFGHQAALTAALDHVTGDVCVLMDGDLQDPPELIPDFLAHYRDGADVVYARRSSRKEPWWLRLSYWGYYRLLARMAGISLPLDAGDFSLLSRQVVDELRRAPERHRYLRGLRAWAGFRQDGVDVDRDERFSGASKYTASRLFRLAFDGIFSFSVAPLRAAALLGALTVALTTLYAAYSVAARLFTGASPRGFTGLILTITFVSGVQLLFLGVVGEYVGRVYEEVKRRPLYVVRDVLEGD